MFDAYGICDTICLNAELAVLTILGVPQLCLECETGSMALAQWASKLVFQYVVESCHICELQCLM